MSTLCDLSIVAHSYAERVAIRVGDSFSLRHEQSGSLEWPIAAQTLPADSPLRALQQKYVRVTLHKGCAHLCIANIAEDACVAVVDALLEPTSDEAAWLGAAIEHTVAKYQAEDCIDANCFFFMTAAFAAHDKGEVELDVLQHEFVRDTVATNKLFVWFGRPGSELSLRAEHGDERFYDPRVCHRYREWLSQSDAFVSAGNDALKEAFKLSDTHEAGWFVFSDQTGVAERGAEVLRQFLRQFEHSWHTALEPLRSPDDVLSVKEERAMNGTSSFANVRLLNLSDYTFEGEQDHCFLRLLRLCERCESLQMVALTCTDNLSLNMVVRVIDCIAESSVKAVFVDESLYLQTSSLQPHLLRLLVPSSADEIQFANAVTKQRMCSRIDEAHSFVMQQFLFPDTDEELNAEHKRVTAAVREADLLANSLAKENLSYSKTRLGNEELSPFAEDKDVIALLDLLQSRVVDRKVIQGH